MSNQHLARNWAEGLAALSADGLRRTLRPIDSAQGPYVTVNGRQMCNFGSNDYLGLANHPQIRAAVKQAVDRWGWGAGASRLVAGHTRAHEELESRLATFKRTAAALVCSTGYQANLAVLRGLAGKGDVILLDKLDHASIIDGAFGAAHAPGGGPVVRTFPHRDYDRLQRLLNRCGDFRRRIIVTDSLFSMDGDVADLRRLVELKERHEALLCIDEAHATGVFGDGGRGVAELMGLEDRIDVVVGTLSKALGGIGGFIAASAEIVDWIVQTAPAFIYTTALPPAACAAAVAALDIVEGEPERRRNLLANAGRLREELGSGLGLDVAGTCSQIIPVIVGAAEETVELARRLDQAGIMVPAIRPPTVPVGRARLRISLSAEHTPADLDRLGQALREYLCTRSPGTNTGRSRTAGI